MMWSKVLTVALALAVLRENLISAEKDRNTKIVMFIRNLMADYDAKYNSTHDVVVFQLKKVGSSYNDVDDLFEEVCKIIPKSMPLHLSPIQAIVEHRNLRPTSFTIIVSDESNLQKLIGNFLAMRKSEYYSNEEKFIFVAVDMSTTEIHNVFRLFNIFRILNVLVIGNLDNLIVASYNPFMTQPFYEINIALTDVDQVFPDKLINLNGYTYKMRYFDDRPRLQVVGGIAYGTDVNFMKIVAHKQNAQLSPIHEKNRDSHTRTATVLNFLVNGSVDVFINTGMHVATPSLREKKMVNTFDTDGFCAMVPYPKSKTYFDFLFKPFDLFTWILVLAAIFCAATVWHLLNKHSTVNANTAGYFIFGFIANFFGQSIPFRVHRASQKIILQLTVILTFILGTLYQGEIISSISNINRITKIKTIDEMIGMNYSYLTFATFIATLNSSDYYHRMEPNIFGEAVDGFDFKMSASDNVAFILPCSKIVDFMFQDNLGSLDESQASRFYYRIEEKFNTFYLEFPTPLLTFFHRRLQEISMIVFESGIRQHNKPDVDGHRNAIDAKYYENEEYYLKLVDIAPAFYVLAIGLTVSFIVLLLEIFCHDCFSGLSFKSICENRRLRKKREIKQRIRPKFIQVRPVNEDFV